MARTREEIQLELDDAEDQMATARREMDEAGEAYDLACDRLGDLQDELDNLDDGGGSDEPDESMDGDFDSGMASAGFGTDEDYGYFGGEDFSF
jgi:hypothetical protein